MTDQTTASESGATPPERQAVAENLNAALDQHEKFVAGTGGKRLSLASVDLSGMNLSGRDLSDAELTGCVLAGSDLRDAKLVGSVLFACDLQNCQLQNAVMDRADLRGAVLRGADLTNGSVVAADLRDGVLMRADSDGNLVELAISQDVDKEATAEVDGRVIEDTALSSSFVKQTDLTDTNLRNARFFRANLTGANLTGSNLQGADLSEANLAGAILHGAVLFDVVLQGADLSDADLAGAVFSDLDREAGHFDGARLPTVFDADGEELTRMIADHLTWVSNNGSKGSRADLSRRDIRGQSLQQTNLSAAVMPFVVAPDSDWRQMYLLMSDLSFADLRNTDLTRSNLRGATLRRANLSGANLAN
ncbi:MAG: pentapeptide repeat-containing protein, partial [Thalassobaculaceae bacterium]